MRSRRRTSEVLSRRPDFDRNSAGSSDPPVRRRAAPGRPRAQVALERAAARARRPARAASCRPCPRPAPARRRSRSSRRRARRAPRRAARRRRRARTSRGRAARAASSPGSGRAAPRPRRLQHARQPLRPLRRAEQLGRVVARDAERDLHAEQRPAAPRACARPSSAPALLGQRRHVAAQRAHVDRRRARAPGRAAQRANWPVSMRVGVRRVAGHRPACEVVVERLERGLPGWGGLGGHGGDLRRRVSIPCRVVLRVRTGNKASG